MFFQVGRLDIEVYRLGDLLLARLVEVETVPLEVIDPLESLTHIDGPAQRPDGYLQLLFQLIQDFKRIFPLTVELVPQRSLPVYAASGHLHQFTGLRLHSLGDIHHHNNAIHGSQRP